MLTDEQLTEALNSLPGERITATLIDARITEVSFTVLSGTTVTLCHIGLDNGFSVRGEAVCVDPENFNQEVGERLAYDDAYSKLGPLFGFLLAEARFNQRNQAAERYKEDKRAARPRA